MKKLFMIILVLMLSLSIFACDKDKEKENNDDADGVGDVGDTGDKGDTGDTGNKDDGKTECTEHNDANGDNKCDVCGADTTPAVSTGTLLANSVIAQLEKAESVKADIDLSIITSNDEWYYETDYETEAEYPYNYKNYINVEVKVTVTVSKTEDGVNAKIDLLGKQKNDPDEDFAVMADETVLYMVDGEVYTLVDGNVYTKSEIPGEVVTALETVISKIAENVTLTEEDKQVIFASVGETVVSVFDVKDNKGSISFDAKPTIDQFFAYVDSINMDKDTVEDVINDALALADPELKIADIVDAIENAAGLTVGEALTELDAFLAENYATDVESLYQSIVTHPDVVKLISEFVTMTAPEDVTEEEIQEQIDSVLTALREFSIREYVTEAELVNVTLYDLMILLASDAPEDQEAAESAPPTKDELFEVIDAVLAMTLSEFEENFGITVFSTVKSIISGITVNKFDGKIDLNFKGIFNIDTIEGEFNFDFESEFPSAVEGKTDKSAFALFAKIKIYDINDAKIDIALPDDASVVVDVIGKYYWIDEDTYLFTYSEYDDNGDFIGISLDICYMDEEGNTVNVYTSVITVDEINDLEYTFTADEIEMLIFNGEFMDTVPEDYEITIVLYPEIEIFDITYTEILVSLVEA